MRHPKNPPPSNSAPPPALSTEPPIRYDEAKSIQVIERLLENALDPDQSLTPDQICDLMEMFITDLHLRKVTAEFWMEVLPLCAGGIKLASQVAAEARLAPAPGLSAEAVNALEGAIQLSVQEISDLRAKLLGKLALLKQCPPPGAKIH